MTSLKALKTIDDKAEQQFIEKELFFNQNLTRNKVAYSVVVLQYYELLRTLQQNRTIETDEQRMECMKDAIQHQRRIYLRDYK